VCYCPGNTLDGKNEAPTMDQTQSFPVATSSAWYLDLYARYLNDPASVPADWRIEFERMRAADGLAGPAGAPPDHLLARLLDVWRTHGHLAAHLDPLTEMGPELPAEIAAAVAGTRRHADTPVSDPWQDGTTTLGAAQARLGEIYAGPSAAEAQHLEDAEERAWLHAAFERTDDPPDADEAARLLGAIALADEFEGLFRTRYPTKKRFGIEGADALIVLLRELLRSAARDGCREVIVGGMHRGRLCMMATVFGKDLTELVAEIIGHDVSQGSPGFTGDVPYHNGSRAGVEVGGRMLDVTVMPHPSHLSVVAPVAIGAARARREFGQRSDVLSLGLHTDAAFAGQGVIGEMLQIGGLAGYSVSGTIHVVVNNQIGFTTLPGEARRTRHPTDIGKGHGIPILHLNGDHPFEVARIARIAARWRSRFAREILINFVCYRRNGHNELDEPRFTQPEIWRRVDAKQPLRESFSRTVAALHPRAIAAADAAAVRFRQDLEDAFTAAPGLKPNHPGGVQSGWAGTGGAADRATGMPIERLREIGLSASQLRPGLAAHRKVTEFYAARRAAIEAGEGLNMATAEYLAFASLLTEGHSVRLTGQDSVRGTFAQRHLAVHDMDGDGHVLPIRVLETDKARFTAINSPLIEYATLAFEYGHSLADPATLVMWEAQFGDFLNGAQTVVDQYITAASARWGLRSGLVIALPHGQEGQGPDHSSARIERILLMCAGGNIRVANPSTPANLFHLLRRQIAGAARKPLFLIAPKSLLRRKSCRSPLSDFAEGTAFRPLIVETPEKPRRLVLCSGKIAHDLRDRLDRDARTDVALVRVEELYPFPADAIGELIERLAPAEIVWCQEEPENQGAWHRVAPEMAGMAIRYAGRPAMSATAGGFPDRHAAEQDAIIEDAIG